jgi:hypothetical protein
VLRSAFSEDESFIEIDLVNKLQSIVEKQRDQIRTLDTSLADIKSELDEVKATMRSSLVVRAYDCQCTSCNDPVFDPSISRHSGI